MRKGKLIFITGGVRSGKSRFAVELARKSGRSIVFIATCVPEDKEMKERVAKHRRSRPAHWKTVEESRDPASALAKLARSTDAVIIDCLTLLVSNLMLAGEREKTIIYAVKKMVRQIRRSGLTAVVISNEVGSGIVPENKIAREFRDLSGKINQAMARASDETYIMFSGLPLRLKGNRVHG